MASPWSQTVPSSTELSHHADLFDTVEIAETKSDSYELEDLFGSPTPSSPMHELVGADGTCLTNADIEPIVSDKAMDNWANSGRTADSH